MMAAERPVSEHDYWVGYFAAKRQLRELVMKVDEAKRLGVLYAWLHIRENDDDRS